MTIKNKIICAQVAGEKYGTKVNDYWPPAMKILADPAKFLQGLINYDKDSMSPSLIKKIEKYIFSADFDPEVIRKVNTPKYLLCYATL